MYPASKPWSRRYLAPAVGVLILVAMAIPAGAQDASSGGTPECDADDGGLSLPSGFCALVVADGLGAARHLVATPDGDLYVALQEAPDGSSALSMAVVNAYYELASMLLDHGADPNLPDPRGSPLHTVAWLRKPGADGAAGVGNTPQGTPPAMALPATKKSARRPSSFAWPPGALLSVCVSSIASSVPYRSQRARASSQKPGCGRTMPALVMTGSASTHATSP